jgi:hypothetical protein
MKLPRTLAAAAGVAVAVLMSTAGLAAAKPLEQLHVHDSRSEVLDGFCGDLTVRHDVEIDQYLSAKPHGPDGLIHFAERGRVTDSWTNLANDKTFTIVNVGQSKDLKVTDNGDGTLTILVARNGAQFVYGPDGTRLFIASGRLRFEIRVDHGGTPTDPADDEFLEFLGGDDEFTGRDDTAGRDFCADIHEFIG